MKDTNVCLEPVKVLLVLNSYDRENSIMESIKREILTLRPNATVKIKRFDARGIIRFTFNYRPNVILTYPFASIGFSYWYYVFKFFMRLKIVVLRVEGVVDFNNEFNVMSHVGFDKYGKSLVDTEIFWGSKTASVLGQKLLEQRKISSAERVKVAGYPRLESYFDTNLHKSPGLPASLKKSLSGYKKKNILFFVTGFHMANYSRKNLIEAGDLDAGNNMEDLLERVENSKKIRTEWVDSIIAAAEKNPDMLFLVKKHPSETRENYKDFEDRHNIIFVYDVIDLNAIIPNVGIFFHYGSTSLVDAYLSRTLSVYVYSKHNKEWYSDKGWPSSVKANIDDICQVIERYRAGKYLFELTGGMRQVLKDIFNIQDGKQYEPAKHIAHLILDTSRPQRILLLDPYLWRAVAGIFIMPKVNRIAYIFKKTFFSVENN